METTAMTGVCGLDCEACDIRLVPTDTDAADCVTAWFHELGWLEENEGAAELIKREMYCRGCREDRSLHWSPDCPLLTCCADERGLEHCAQCEDFACEKVEPFAHDGQAHHREAVERLRQITAS
jgi:hypothetical protein